MVVDGCQISAECQLSNHRRSIYESIIKAALIHYQTIGKLFIKAARIAWEEAKPAITLQTSQPMKL
jgi:hypothetical protein